MSAKHTPGPWRLSPDVERTEWVAPDDSAHAVDARDPVDGALFEVAAVWGLDRCEKADDRSLANARLIAAAPRLLAALIAMERKASKQNWNDHYPEELAEARAAIDEATGEQP